MRCNSRYVVAEYNLMIPPGEAGAECILRLCVSPLIEKQVCTYKKMYFRGCFSISLEYVPLVPVGEKPVYYKAIKIPYAAFIKCRKIRPNMLMRVIGKVELQNYELINERSISLVIAASFVAVRSKSLPSAATKSDPFVTRINEHVKTSVPVGQSEEETINPEVLPNYYTSYGTTPNVITVDTEAVGLIGHILAVGKRIWSVLIGFIIDR